MVKEKLPLAAATPFTTSPIASGEAVSDD